MAERMKKEQPVSFEVFETKDAKGRPTLSRTGEKPPAGQFVSYLDKAAGQWRSHLFLGG